MLPNKQQNKWLCSKDRHLLYIPTDWERRRRSWKQEVIPVLGLLFI